MKLNDFHKRSDKRSVADIQKRLGRSSKISFVNETQISTYENSIKELTEENSKLNLVLSELETAKLQRQEAINTKKSVELELEKLNDELTSISTSLAEYENREPKIKNVIKQHRELNGQVAELQGKLQIVIDAHDTKVDMVNDKIIEIDTIKKSLHSAELAETKATQSKLSAIMERDALQAKADQETKKYDDLSIIYQGNKNTLFKTQQDRNTLKEKFSRVEVERDKLKVSTQKFKVLSENQSETLADLANQYYYVSKINKELLVELKKPRFASVASISKKEGFKFPTSYEPRSNTLGTGKPTLLRKKD